LSNSAGNGSRCRRTEINRTSTLMYTFFQNSERKEKDTLVSVEYV